MNARTIAPPSSTRLPRFDVKFIEEQQLIERYLEGKLPPKGARELEDWCRANPDYLNRLNLANRTAASLKLLEASGRPADLSEPAMPWWRTPSALVACTLLTAASMVAVWALYGKYRLLRSELADTQIRMHRGSLLPSATTSDIQVSPDHAPGIDRAKLAVNGNAPQLMDVHIDMNYTKASQFRLIVDKMDQGRALILNNLMKDSNGDLRLTFNTSGVATGSYRIRIEALPSRAGTNPVPEGWLILDVH